MRLRSVRGFGVVVARRLSAHEFQEPGATEVADPKGSVFEDEQIVRLVFGASVKEEAVKIGIEIGG